MQNKKHQQTTSGAVNFSAGLTTQGAAQKKTETAVNKKSAPVNQSSKLMKRYMGGYKGL